MLNNIKKRLTAGILAVCSLASCIPLASAEEGIMPLAEEDDEPSSIVFQEGDACGKMRDANARDLTITGNSTIWTAEYTLEDGTIVHCYCASKGKRSPQHDTYHLTERVSNWKLASLANISDARLTHAEFLNHAVNENGNGILNATNFPARAYFAACQIAVWTALGQGYIAAGSGEGFSWESSTQIQTASGEKAYPITNLQATFGVDGSTTTEDRLVLYAAIKMLEYAVENGAYYEELGHVPYPGGAFTYGADYQDSGFLNLATSIKDSGKFMEEEYTRLQGPYTGETKKYWVFHMAANSATWVRGKKISLIAKNLPEGAFLKTTNMEEGSPHVYESMELNGAQVLGLNSVEQHNEYYENDNQAAWGQEFDLYIPQDKTAEITVESPIELTADMNVDRYESYIATPDNDSSCQNMLVVAPSVVHQTIKWMLTAIEDDTEEYVNLKLVKKDADDATKSLKDAKFKIEYTKNEVSETEVGTTGEDGTVTFDRLPLGAEVTITETEAPAGYALMSPNPDKVTLPSTPTETGIFEYTLTDKPIITDTVGLKIIKKDAENATKSLQGAEFKVEYTDAGTPKTLTGTTGADGSVSFSGLPLGAQVTITETNPPVGYKLMSPNLVTKTLPATPGETGVVEYTFTDQKNPDVPNIPDVQKLSLRVIKVDNGTSVPLKGFTFELYKGTTLITSGTTDDNGEIMFTDLEPGDYRVREAGGTEDYAVDAPDQFITLVKDESEIPTLTFRNDKKRDYRIKKVDAEAGAAIPGVVFEIFRDGQSLGQLPPTDANGEVQLEHTEFGTYNVKEVTVPPEYVKSDETFIMEIDKDSQNPFIFTIPNKHKKKLTLKKIDEETGEPMSGVTFDIYLNNNKIDSKTTENGEIVI